MAARGITDDAGTDDERPVPYPEQQPFMGRAKRYYGFISGTGAGKTFAGVFRTWMNATTWNPDSMGAILVPDKSQFTDNIKPIMEDLGMIRRGEPGGWEYKSVYTDEPGLRTPSGERILILSADNQRQIGRLKGKNLAYVWMDEEAEIPPRARQIADQRLRVGNYPNLYITTTPDGKNHTYDFFDGDVNPEKRRSGKGMIYECDDRLAVVGVPPEANPEMRDEDIAAMRRTLPDAIVQQEIEGQFVEIGSGILTREMLSAAPSDVLDTTELTYHVGVDLGIEPDASKAEANDTDYFAAAILAHHRRHGEAFVVDVARKRGLSLSQGVEWLKTVVQGVPQPTINVESVHAQRYFLQAAKDAGLPVQGVEQSLTKEDRLIQLSIPFENDRIRLVNFNQDPADGPEERWRELIQEWIAFPDGTHDDMLDAVEIATRNLSIGQAFGADALDLYGRDTDA
jgi:predicted phage terminase large subunit-like protein